MRQRLPVSALALLCVVTFGVTLCHAQQDQADHRKVVNRVTPEYPPVARAMMLGGTVRVEALVNSNGTVKSAEVKGGHPVLADAAVRAVRKWKWQPADHETHEVVELKFEPAIQP